MAESKVRDDNFFLVSGWMLNRLNLKGVPLQVFSIIYGFSQDGEGSFTGSLQYLCDFTNASKNTIIKALKELVEKKYIVKSESTINGVRFCTYKANAPVVQKLNWGGAETEPNNIPSDNKNNISKDICNDVVDLYHSICISYPRIRSLTEARKKAINARLNTHSMEGFKTVFENAEASSFMKGRNNRHWSADFDWMLKEDNFVKVLEDVYADRGKKEKLPSWYGHLGEAELQAIEMVMRDDPETQKEREQLEKELQAFGRKECG